MTHPEHVETSKHVQITATQQVGVILTVIDQPNDNIFFTFPTKFFYRKEFRSNV